MVSDSLALNKKILPLGETDYGAPKSFTTDPKSFLLLMTPFWL